MGHEDKCVFVKGCVWACTERIGLPVEWSMWMPTHSAASRPSSFRINPQSLNINRRGVLKLCSTNRRNGIMHRPYNSQLKIWLNSHSVTLLNNFGQQIWIFMRLSGGYTDESVHKWTMKKHRRSAHFNYETANSNDDQCSITKIFFFLFYETNC